MSVSKDNNTIIIEIFFFPSSLARKGKVSLLNADMGEDLG